ncbi:MAG TPA: S24 family peptidase [Thermoanaerobaculia bacterium]|nr:S24 family peptidase [Thermoanaerobaculia bacterium]
MPDPAHALAALLLEDAARFDQVARSLPQRSIDLPIAGHSMEPTIADGETVRVGLGSACTRGDVVVFRQDARIVAHRVVHRSSRFLIARGDGRIAPDPPVACDRVLGVVTSPLPPMRRHWLQRFVLDAPFTLFMIVALHLRIGTACSRFLRMLERRVLFFARVAHRVGAAS